MKSQSRQIQIDPGAPYAQTPWGTAQAAWEHSPGLIFVTTAAHGGYWLSPARWEHLTKLFPMFRPFADRAPWLEEDIDACMVPLCWPELYEDQHLFNAVRTVIIQARQPMCGDWQAILQWIQEEPEGYIRQRASMFSMEQCRAQSWERGGLSSGPDDPGWWVHLQQYPNGEQRTLCFREYPTKQFYTEEELKALVMPEEEIQAWKQEQARKTRLEWHTKYGAQHELSAGSNQS